MEERSSALGQSLRVLLVVLLLGLAVHGVWLPGPKDASTPVSEVSEARAREHLNEIASAPHATGTEEAQRVREYIRSELESLGVETRFLAGTVEDVRLDWLYVRPESDPDEEAAEQTVLVDIFARIPGRGDGGVMLFACHYDSVARDEDHTAPGAGDDGAAAASMIELARVLTAGKPLANDVWLLFTDGEELGLLGAQLFCEQAELVEQIDVVFNFEGIGNNGPSVMFQTSPGNSRLIDEFAQLDCAKVAPSFAQAIYERMPNDTDFTVFAHHGLIGLNFSIIGGRSAYHRAWDTPENLGAGALQYQLDTMYALSQQFGETDLETLESDSDELYFDLLGLAFVRFSKLWNYVLLTLGCIACALWVQRAMRSGVQPGRAMLTTAQLGLYSGAHVLVFVYAITVTLKNFARIAGFSETPRGDSLSAFLIGWGGLAVGFVAVVSWLARTERKARPASKSVEEVMLAGSLLWLLLALLGTYWLPLGSYFATIPLLLSAAVAPHFASRIVDGRTSNRAVVIALAILLLLGPSVGLLVLLYSASLKVTAIFCALVALLGAPLALPLAHWTRVRTKPALVVAWGLALTLLVAAGWLRALGL